VSLALPVEEFDCERDTGTCRDAVTIDEIVESRIDHRGTGQHDLRSSPQMCAVDREPSAVAHRQRGKCNVTGPDDEIFDVGLGVGLQVVVAESDELRVSRRP